MELTVKWYMLNVMFTSDKIILNTSCGAQLQIYSINLSLNLSDFIPIARCKGFNPLLSRISKFPPAACNKSRKSSLPYKTIQCNAVRDKLSWAFTSTPAERRKFKHSIKLPWRSDCLDAALWMHFNINVFPSLSLAFVNKLHSSFVCNEFVIKTKFSKSPYFTALNADTTRS